MLCRNRWEDAFELFEHDPFWLANRTSNWWESFYHYMSYTSQCLLDPSKTYVAVQRLVRQLASGEKVQDFAEIFPIGCSRTHALIAATVEAQPKTFYLHSLRINDIRPPRTELVRRKQQPVSPVSNYDVEKNTEKAFETTLENIEPAWEIVDGSHLPGPPILSALDPISGTVALVCQGKIDRVHLFTVPHQRLPSVQLPVTKCEPDCIAVSAQYLAVGYSSLVGNVEGISEPFAVPPHIQLYSISSGMWSRVPYIPTNNTANKQGNSNNGETKRKRSEDRVNVLKFSCFDFHRSRPNLLLVGTMDGGVVVCNVDYMFAVAHNHPELDSRILYPGPDLQQIYEHFRYRAETDADEMTSSKPSPEQIIHDMPTSGRQPIWFINWRDFAEPADTRLIVGMQSAFAFMNGTQDTVRDKMTRFGKKTLAYEPRDTPSTYIDSCGDVMVIHDAAHNDLIIGQTSRCTPRWVFNHPDVVATIPSLGRPYPSLALFSSRIVVLYPNGMVGFCEIADVDMQSRYAAERAKHLAEGLEQLKISSSDK